MQKQKAEPRLTFSFTLFALVFTLLFTAQGFPVWAQTGNNTIATKASSGESRSAQTFSHEGVSIEFSMSPMSADGRRANDLLAGNEASVRFKITDAASGKPLSNLRPIAWIDPRDKAQSPDAQECREKVQAFLQPNFARRAAIDLNAYFVLTLNHEPNISVIDPLSGFGGSKLYTLVALDSSGADWVMSADQKRLYVSMPAVNQVAVVDTLNWKVITNLEAGEKPTRIALQRDGRYLWVGNDAVKEKDSGVTVIDTATLKTVAQIKTGAGHHEFTFSDDDSLAFVTNREAGTLSLIDVRRLVVMRDLKIGMLPAAIAFSSLSRSVYVANEADGMIVVIDASTGEIQTRIKAQPGLGALRILPNGRFGFVANKATNTISIFDISSNRMVHAVPVAPGADQITFTREFAYIRSSDTEFVLMIKLANLGKETALSRFPAGQKPPRDSQGRSFADAIVPAPEEGAVLVANPADKMIYYYTEGMAAPMGSFQNYRREPKALLVLDNSLRESVRGEYTTTVRLGGPGAYDVAFLLDSPRLVKCFEITVSDNPSLAKPATRAIRIEPVSGSLAARVGDSYRLRFKVVDSISQQQHTGLEDLVVLVYLAPGIWQQRLPAANQGNGIYEISFVPPQAGVYYVHFQCPSLNMRFNQISPLVLQATDK
ncbi:MAG TPA: cytochrome D1 domain-containing protein [Pyrinomonadaceae bacterium]|nr:cytochrome D1 domain-containing protein [Pyrinomonadaceae bacterium]